MKHDIENLEKELKETKRVFKKLEKQMAYILFGLSAVIFVLCGLLLFK